MRASQFHFATTRETPAEAEIASHQLMLRTGMVRKLGSGIYTWSPLGWRVLRKVEQIVREEMDRAGCLEMLMPSVQPSELWEETGRWGDFGPLLLKIKDRGQREYCYGPTHEEVITEFARAEIRSYKQLPVCFYQIQTKFRDEIRPRFGVMRAREFTMKDAYSFHLTDESLDETYWKMFDAYSSAFTRMGLTFRAVRADSGAIGGDVSHEFQVMAESGEDEIAYSVDSDYAANVEAAEGIPSVDERPAASSELTKVATPNVGTIDAVARLLDVKPTECVKTLLVKATSGEFIALVLRGDHQLNEIKASRLPELADGFEMADEKAIRATMGAGPGSIGPVVASIPVIVDRSAAVMADFVCGANEDGFHCSGTNWERDANISRVEDLRNVVAGDPSPDGTGELAIARGIEVGHIFKLGTKYSESMNAVVMDENSKAQTMTMGCYGIGISRIVAAAIEQNHDENGIQWPQPLAPFDIAILPMNAHKSERVRCQAESLYDELTAAGWSVLLDDRKQRPGVMFADMDLIGIPHRVVIGDRGLDKAQVEYRDRRAADNEFLDLDGLAGELQARLRA